MSRRIFLSSPQLRGRTLTVANAGDSRCVLCRDGQAVDMSVDHKPTQEEERNRILKAGGFISDGRVNGCLALSRAIGDLEFKRSYELGPEEQVVTAYPELKTLEVQPQDEFIILACDGIWDVLTSQACVDFVRTKIAAGLSLKAVCEALCDRCMAQDTRGSGIGCDNMTVVIVKIKPVRTPPPPTPTTKVSRHSLLSHLPVPELLQRRSESQGEGSAVQRRVQEQKRCASNRKNTCQAF